jgi:hypothetical protein
MKNSGIYKLFQQIHALQTDVRQVVVGARPGGRYIIAPKKGDIFFKFNQSTIHAEYLYYINISKLLTPIALAI